MLSAPPAIIQSAIPACILAAAIAMVSTPDEQNRLTVTPGTSTLFNPISDINLAILSP